ncbi:hypothetical protein LI951_05185 [Enterococcus sp. BWT-B8]|uniref:hypothetical protein n=1 Tax=Enterococcus sp. BWT-B8 TaxID=2885157 RepID=UPI001E6473A0|nr:hypothetical protein [Enterococcus sp. BWT-B8]MCB5951452.1 hypothetical protein [Enterococcus sp. BWT-B8]
MYVSSELTIYLHSPGGKLHFKNRFYYAVNEAVLLNEITFDTVFFGAAGLENSIISSDDLGGVYLKKRC